MKPSQLLQESKIFWRLSSSSSSVNGGLQLSNPFGAKGFQENETNNSVRENDCGHRRFVVSTGKSIQKFGVSEVGPRSVCTRLNYVYHLTSRN